MDRPNWGGGASHRRGREKLDAVVRWLAWFDYSDYATLARMLKVNERGQSGFFRRLRESEFVRVLRVPGIRAVLIGLTNAGVDRARLIVPEVPLGRRPHPSWVTMVHLLSVQNAILRRDDQVVQIQPEKMLEALRGDRLPDALLTLSSGERMALEVELNHKQTARIYHAFFGHLKSIRGGQYESVLYIFPSEGLANLYRSKFNEPLWPIYKRDLKTRKLVEESDRPPFEAARNGVIESGKFEFTVEGAYAL